MSTEIGRLIEAALQAARHDPRGIDWPDYLEAFEPIVRAVMVAIDPSGRERHVAELAQRLWEQEFVIWDINERTDQSWEDAPAAERFEAISTARRILGDA